MNFYKSSIKEPIGFFEDYFLQKLIYRHFEEFKDSCIRQEISNPSSVKVFVFDGDCVIHTQAYNYAIDEYGNTNEDLRQDFTLTESFSGTVERLLKSEVDNSRHFIRKACNSYLSKFNDISTFLIFQQDLINELFRNCTDIFKDFPFCMDQLKTLEEFVNLFLGTKFISTIDSNDILGAPGSKASEINYDPISEIINYLKGKNDHGQIIMPEKDYDSLRMAIEKIINNDEVPNFTTKLHIHVPVGVLRYTFYLVLPFVGENKDYFLQFLLDNISEFARWSFDPFKTKISVPPSILPGYLPPLFKENKLRQMNKNK